MINKFQDIFNLSIALLAIGDLISVYLSSCMHRTFYEKREWAKDKKWVVFSIYLVNFILLFSANMLEYPPVNLASCILCYFIPLFFCYDIKNIRGLVYWFFYFLSNMIIEIVFGIVCGLFTSTMGFETRYDFITPHVSVIINLTELIVVLNLCLFGKKENNSRVNKVSFIFMLIPVVSTFLVVTDVFLLTKGKIKNFNPNQFLWTAIVLLVVNISVFVLLEKFTTVIKREMELSEEKIKLQSDADIMSLATKSMKERLDISERMVQQDRVMRHDRRHFEATILSLLENGKEEEAIKSLKERLDFEPHVCRKYCENTTVNAAVSHYIARAKEEGIQVSADLTIPSLPEVDEMELAITISNLLENAINACKKVEDKYIKINSRYKKQLLLEIVNSCDGNVKFDKNGYPFTKEKNHGVGTRSVLAFVNKTKSEINYSINNREFCVRMIINA